MTATRDPRVYPRPGDVVRSFNGITRHIEEVRYEGTPHCMVDWRVSDYGYSEPLDRWRELNADSEIVKVAE